MITKQDVEHIAKLARLEIEDSELDLLTKNLGNILNYVDQLSEVDTEGIEPLRTASEIKIQYREDVVIEELSTEEKLRNAPDTSGHLFKVPPVVS